MKKILAFYLCFYVLSAAAQGNCIIPGYPGCTRDDFDRALQIQGQIQQQQQFQIQQQQFQQQQLQEMRRSNQIMEQQLQQQRFDSIMNYPMIPVR